MFGTVLLVLREHSDSTRATLTGLSSKPEVTAIGCHAAGVDIPVRPSLGHQMMVVETVPPFASHHCEPSMEDDLREVAPVRHWLVQSLQHPGVLVACTQLEAPRHARGPGQAAGGDRCREPCTMHMDSQGGQRQGGHYEYPDGKGEEGRTLCTWEGVIDMHETFCVFHGLQLNNKKCEHMVMNAPAHNLQWTGEKDRLKAADARGEGEQVLGA